MATEPSIAAGSALARIYQSLADFTELTRLLRGVVDERLGRHLEVTGWHAGEMRVHLDQPALATRWRFQEPAVRRALSRHAALKELQGIRLVTTHLRASKEANTAVQAGSLRNAPVTALKDMASHETHDGLRAALLRLSAAAAQAQATPHK